MGETSHPAMGAVPSGAPPLAAIRRLRHRHIIDRLDYLRGLRRLAAGMTQADLAKELGLTQPSISSALKSAAKIPDPPAGFSGASVYEIAQRFTAGELGRDELVDQLSRWPDATAFDRLSALESLDSPDSVDSLDHPDSAGPPDGVDGAEKEHGPLRELSKALRDRLLDEAVYRAVLDRRKRLGRLSVGMPTTAASGE